MYLETVKQITDVESEMEQAKAAARAQVQQQLAEAERAGKELLQRVQTEARIWREEALADARKKAAGQQEEMLRGAADECERLRRAAADRMEQAADKIVERVVER